MEIRSVTIHITVCLVVGGLVAFFTPAKWLAVAFWVSAAMYLNGSVATVEDALPGGFENPDGSTVSHVTKGSKASWFAIKTLAVVVVLVSVGFYIQFG